MAHGGKGVSSGHSKASGEGRLKGWRFRIVAIGVVLAVLITGGTIVGKNYGKYYVYSPGSAPSLTASPACQGSGNLKLPDGKPCAQIVVPGGKAHSLDGSVIMVDVEVGPATPVEYVLGKLGLLGGVQEGAQLVPARQATGGANSKQLACEDAAEMTSSQLDAPVAALRSLGYQVKENDNGAALSLIEPGGPAALAGLKCNDTVVGIDGKPVKTSEDLVNAIHGKQPGQTVAVTYSGASGKGAPKTTNVRLGGFPAAIAKQAGAKPGSVYMGISPVTNVSFDLPFNVGIRSGNIGGPSAGLAFTLGIVDMLTNGKLTNGLPVAATGEISPTGQVLDVGGVAQKTIAVKQAGAKVFFVPKGEYKDALSKAGKGMSVYPVSSLTDVFNQLEKMGGQVPPPAPGPPAPPG